MNLQQIAIFKSPFPSKFGIPKQSGLIENLQGHIVFEERFRDVDFIRGLEGFEYLWLIWGFSANTHGIKSPLVRPPRLGGNQRMGVFATRSPFRPNMIGLSSVRIETIDYAETNAPVIHVKGADLMDGTPIYDIKPYVEYTDSHPNVRCGFVDKYLWNNIEVDFPESLSCLFSKKERDIIVQVLSLDPRPQYQDNPEKIYGMPIFGYDVRFKVKERLLQVVDIVKL